MATGFGVGKVGFAPGTFGTLLGVPVYLVLMQAAAGVYLLALALLLAFAVWVCGIAERGLPHDDASIVLDEIVGYLITMYAAPVGWVWVIAGFLWFRLFDIWKPFPIGRIDRSLPGGFGTVLDDAAAGVYAWAGLQATALLIGAPTLVP
ncbi:phosphatidylglycerophosphatase A [Sulfurifustis variabilis]|uniref:Phosphatidylglycerophosphatase A n=1 Tax=Sulfurifustis variabilis TaxID=1675686 RepID=A0A1B4VBH6_9GAMM|nr:phosphatidylglycerophosphatase A [Sulfurifustis variabilis]BAU48001.1 phosphatidylglycerophosphatase A [Sulfurifustis variabilis]